MDYKVFIIRNNKLIYLSRMQSCLCGWSCYDYILAQRPISHRIHIFLVTLSIICKIRNLRNRLRDNMVCEWVWVSIPGERDLPKSLNWCLAWSPDHTYRYVRMHANTHTDKRARTPYYHDTQTKTKIDVQ